VIGIRITWELATPIVAGGYPLHLDALVAYAVAKEGMQANPEKWQPNAILDLPLQAQRNGDVVCYQASALIPSTPGEHGMRFWTRRTNTQAYAGAVEDGQVRSKSKFPLKPYGMKIDTVRGTFKQMFKFYPVRQVRTLQAWCIGDLDRLAELLQPESGLINYIGAKGRMGHGRVMNFDIQSDDSAVEKWTQRVLPWPKDGYIPVQAAAAPPYWDVSNRTDAWIHPDLFN
jgi:CRISPR type IV-associated protein Csf3